LLNLKLANVLPCGINLETPYPFPLLSPFCAEVKFLHHIVHHLFKLSSPMHLFSVRDPWAFLPHPFPLYMRPPSFPPPSISSLRAGWVPSIQFLFPLLSPLYTHVGFPLTWFSLTLPSPLYAWVKFPLIQFSFPLPSLLNAWVEFFLIQFLLTFLCCRSMVPSVKL
jgi:hypothetical protein